MHMSGVDQAFWLAGFACEICLMLVLVSRREYTRFPIFVVWIVLSLLIDPLMYWFSQHGSTVDYNRAYIVTAVLDYMLQLGVLSEIALRVLRPASLEIPKAFLIVLSGILALVFTVSLLWTFGQTSDGPALDSMSKRLLNVDFGFAYLRLAVFALIAGFSQMLGITWKNHVIRLAGGMAFYSGASVVIQVSISHLSRTDLPAYLNNYFLLAHLQVTAYVGSLLFWVWSFVQKDAPRREFTPQMQHFLVSLSETARRSRLGLTRSLGHK